ncbi:hypothetical protein GH714_002133 [Hevea brasiliensis]|uniref:protein-serine/threonine phosphatase n=1 Tax=Hevea brasiliensis TaxID=3981 RepID=A0A6A6KZF9_HEVBR|nr:hypothetical protein GH714_002133 [Hevea brasiliensis]
MTIAATPKSKCSASANAALYEDGNVMTSLRNCTWLGQEDIEIRRQYNLFLPYFLNRRFSTAFTSVHGERPSAEYAKLRKESLESEFGQALGTYSSERVSIIYRFGPFLAFYRAAIISYHVLKLTLWQFFVQDIKKRAIKFRETLIHLGPFYIKLGQALSIRPDILPTVYCQELAKLQDQIPPFPTHVAIKSIESQLGVPISQIFSDISPEPIAAASLGQVYKAHLHSGELVAVKVQRPGMSLLLTLDALLFHMIGGQLKRFAKARKDLLVAVNEMVRHMFDEIDYILEGKNAERFASLYGCDPCNDPKSHLGNAMHQKKENCVKVPKIYWDMTCKGVLTMEWVDGIKLTDEARLKKACLNRRKLIDQLVHFVNRDSLGLANDFLSLGFIPEGVDIQSVSDALQASFGDGTKQSRDFEAIMNQLYDVMYEFDFSLPPDYALVVRALGSLEGTAQVLDPNFKVVESAYPFVIGRLLADPNPDMRRILRELLICNDGSVRWNRLERLIVAISEQASESAGEASNSEANSSNTLEWKSFDMRAVVGATDDLLHFILSEKGWRVRVFLVRDMIKVADVILEDEVVGYILDEKHEAREESKSEGHSMFMRVVNGFQYLRQAVRLAPEMWSAMLIRMCICLKPFMSKFSLELPGLGCKSEKIRGGLPEIYSKNMGYLNSVLSSSNQVHADDAPVSGGGLSQNGKFSYGYASSPGKRSSMEDFYETRIDGVDGEIVGLFGVFDGHGGARAAEYVKQNLFSNLISHPKFISDTRSAIADAYNHTDSEFLKSENNQNRDAGSTASTAILVGDRLLVANVGDSRAVICRGGNAIAVSRDHKPDQTDERQRIEDAGGFVMWAGTWRVGGVLAVSRAFGDRLLKQYVVADPEIQEEKIDSSLEFLILASDGLWDVVSNEEAVEMTKPIEDPEQAAKRLLQEAYQRGSADNITCVVVRFLVNQGATSHGTIGVTSV